MTTSIKLSIVIPCYTLNEDLEEKADFAAASYRANGADEIIIVEDGGNYSQTLRDMADIYVYCKDNVGFSKTVNRGWKLSCGNYTGIVNSDTYWMKGNLKDLCVDGKVTSPNIITGDAGHMAGSFFVVPRLMSERYGMLNEKLRNFCSDTDYEWRVYPHIKRIDSVEVGHDVNSTLKAANIDLVGDYKADNDIYHQLIKEGKAHAPH